MGLNERKRRAYHEAGHAVAHVPLCLPTAAVEIFQTPINGAWGQAHPPEIPDVPAFLRSLEPFPERSAVLFLSGPFAEAVITKRKRIHVLLEQSHDFEPAKGLFAQLAADGRSTSAEESFAIACVLTDEYLRDYWPAITAVADALMQCGRLEGAEVAEIIRRTNFA